MGSPTNAGTPVSAQAAAGVAKLRETLVPQSVTVSPKSFVLLYALLGTVQAMVYVYFIGTLTSFERRFRLPSITTGIILAGNELGQAGLSLAFLLLKRRIVSRPVCLAWAVALSAVSCFILAGPYMGYGSAPWDRNHALTPYAAEAAARNSSFGYGGDWQNEAAAKSAAATVTANEICDTSGYPRLHSQQCTSMEGYSAYSEWGWGEYGGLPTILGFVAHLLLGAATTIYLSLGQIYVDAGGQKTSLPLLLGLTLSLRAVGPALGFLLAAGCTALFDDQALVPMIRRNDPRWIGAWWLGWFLLGSVLLLCAVPLAVFAKRIRVASYKEQNILQQATRALRNGNGKNGTEIEKSTSLEPLQAAANAHLDEDDMRGVAAGIRRLTRNKIFMCNVFSGVFYLFGTCGFLNFITKYLEVQFDLSAAVANLIIAPTSIVAILSGLTIAGVVISRLHPRPRVLLAWNVIVGVIYVLGHVAFIFLGCNDTSLQGYSPYSYEKFQLTMECNRYCQCKKQFNPVCDTQLQITYFSGCHAGCTFPIIDYDVKGYNNCSCKGSDFGAPFHANNYQIGYDSVRAGGTYNNWQDSRRQYDPRVNTWQQQQYPGGQGSYNNPRDDWNRGRGKRQTYPGGSYYQGSPGTFQDYRGYGSAWRGMTVGVCEPYCGTTLVLFIVISFIIQMLGSSGRIGNLLVNYRSADPADKPLAQVISLITVSVFGLIPGLIIFGKVIDATCIVWDDTCGLKGPCLLYDRTYFRLYFNILSLICIAIGALLDAMACYLGRDLQLYPNEDEDEESQKDDDEQYDAEPPPPPPSQNNPEVLQPLEQHTGSSSTV